MSVKLPIFGLSGKRIWVAGHKGMLGSAIVRRLAAERCDIVQVGRETLDLTHGPEVASWLGAAKVDAIVLAAAKVGGIHANSVYPADFLQENLSITMNVLDAARLAGVSRLVNFGSSCMYPRAAAQPIAEESLLTGPLEPTNEAYAVAKIAGVKLVEAYRRQHGCDFISLVPTNLYGPGDNFDPAMSHVVPGLIRRLDAAKKEGRQSLSIWGSGKPRRELMFVDDAADAVVFLLQRYSGDAPMNIGVGTDVAIADLAAEIASIVGFDGDLEFDTTKPDGMPRKLLDSSRLAAMGWRGGRPLREGLLETCRWFMESRPSFAGVPGLRDMAVGTANQAGTPT